MERTAEACSTKAHLHTPFMARLHRSQRKLPAESRQVCSLRSRVISINR